jgi:hypothetical protein
LRRAVGEWWRIERKRIARPTQHHWHWNLSHLAALGHLLHSLLHGLLPLRQTLQSLFLRRNGLTRPAFAQLSLGLTHEFARLTDLLP